MRVKHVKNADATRAGVELDCPGCSSRHFVPVGGPNGWRFNEDVDRPTLEPSVLLRDARTGKTQCHFTVTDGVIRFCDDSTHPLAGAERPLAELT